MKKIKAVLCDFDGTLVDHNGKYLPDIKTYINNIKNKNIRFSLATGRAYYSSSLKLVESDLKIQDIHILHGGGLIYNSLTKKILWEQPITNESLEMIIKYFLDNHLMFSLEGKECVYLPYNQKNFLFYQDVLIKNVAELNDSDQIFKIVLFAKANKLNQDNLNYHMNNLKRNCTDISSIEFEFSDLYGADITSEKATKHTAVLEYLKILNIKPDEVIAIGDGPNDYPLFTACGFGIAMSTAPKELKEIANLVVDNIVQALEYIDKKLTSSS